MGRLTIIDGFRGFFLLFMAVVHFGGLTDSWLAKVNHHSFGFVEDAQGFVFVSGLMVGLVYGRKFLKGPTVARIAGPLLDRVRTIYSHQVGLILILLAVALALGAAAPRDLAPYVDAPLTFTVSSLLLLSSSAHMGILPMYIFFMLAAPFAFWMLHRGLVVPFFLLMVVLWLVAQTGLAGFTMYRLQLALGEIGVPARFGLYFNSFAWQALFFSGLYFGYRMAEGRLDLSFLREEQYRVAFFIALGAVVLLGVWDRVVDWQLLGEDGTRRFISGTHRSLLSFVYPIAFALDLFLIVWLLQVGGRDRVPMVRQASDWLRWLFTRPFLVVLGQHSLHVFSAHILVYYLLAILLTRFEPSAFGREAILVVAVASLYLVAWGRNWQQERAAGGGSGARGEAYARAGERR